MYQHNFFYKGMGFFRKAALEIIPASSNEAAINGFYKFADREITADNWRERVRGIYEAPVSDHEKRAESFKKLARDPNMYYIDAWGVSSYERYQLNGNGDGFPKKELIASYGTFIDRGVYIDHNNKDKRYAIGIICDSVWDEDKDRVRLLLAIAKKEYPDMVEKIRKGEITDVSMGVFARESECTRCHNIATHPSNVCECVRMFKGKDPTVGELNYGLNFIEISEITNVGADDNAKDLKEIAAGQKDTSKEKSSMAKKVVAVELGDAKQKIKSKIDELNKALEVIDREFPEENAPIVEDIKEDGTPESAEPKAPSSFEDTQKGVQEQQKGPVEEQAKVHSLKQDEAGWKMPLSSQSVPVVQEYLKSQKIESSYDAKEGSLSIVLGTDEKVRKEIMAGVKNALSKEVEKLAKGTLPAQAVDQSKATAIGGEEKALDSLQETSGAEYPVKEPEAPGLGDGGSKKGPMEAAQKKEAKSSQVIGTTEGSETGDVKGDVGQNELKTPNTEYSGDGDVKDKATGAVVDTTGGTESGLEDIQEGAGSEYPISGLQEPNALKGVVQASYKKAMLVSPKGISDSKLWERVASKINEKNLGLHEAVMVYAKVGGKFDEAAYAPLFKQYVALPKEGSLKLTNKQIGNSIKFLSAILAASDQAVSAEQEDAMKDVLLLNVADSKTEPVEISVDDVTAFLADVPEIIKPLPVEEEKSAAAVADVAKVYKAGDTFDSNEEKRVTQMHRLNPQQVKELKNNLVSKGVKIAEVSVIPKWVPVENEKIWAKVVAKAGASRATDIYRKVCAKLGIESTVDEVEGNTAKVVSAMKARMTKMASMLHRFDKIVKTQAAKIAEAKERELLEERKFYLIEPLVDKMVEKGMAPFDRSLSDDQIRAYRQSVTKKLAAKTPEVLEEISKTVDAVPVAGAVAQSVRKQDVATEVPVKSEGSTPESMVDKELDSLISQM